MLYLAKRDDEKFYVNPEDAKQYTDEGYEIVNTETGKHLTLAEIMALKPETFEVSL